MERIDGEGTTMAGEGHAASRMHLRNTDDESSGFADLRDRFREQADRITTAIDRRTGLVSVVRKKPLAALGLAFSVGFVVAAATTAGDRHWAVERARRQLRAAIIGGLAATFADELRDFLSGHDGIGAIVHSLITDEDEPDL